VPLFEVDARPVRPHARELPDLADVIAHVLHEVSRRLLEPEEPAHQEDAFQDVVHGARVGAEDGQPAADQLRADIGLEIREG
jgi:hypothetical protein